MATTPTTHYKQCMLLEALVAYATSDGCDSSVGISPQSTKGKDSGLVIL